ncbi:MAG: TRAP transporter large permease subunit, partial [Firmicutes bacterium]|nr:TRAP transporter large permease subunit [Bacillota bacterium]
VAFAIALSLALIVNYGFDAKKHREAVDRHAKSAAMMAGVIFAAGVFTGIMNKGGMMESVALVIAENIPQSLGGMTAVIVAILGLTVGVFATSPDAFFFGLMPIMVEVGRSFGVDPLLMGRVAVFARNSVVGVSPLTPAVFLLMV